MDDTDAQLLLKKRARRRLVGAIAFFSVVVLVLPMVMDHEPRQAVQDVEIRIPGQDEKPFAPKFAVAPVDKAPAKQAEVAAPAEPVAPPVKAVEPAPEKPVPVVVEKAVERPVDKTAAKAVDKPQDKAVSKPEKPTKSEADAKREADAKKEADAKRVAAILAGQGIAPTPVAAPAAAKSGEFVVLIGAFSNEANVKNLKSKLAEQNIKTFSEPLETPQGKKTRVRAGPFPNREAAEKALEKMQRIGVSGVVSGK